MQCFRNLLNAHCSLTQDTYEALEFRQNIRTYYSLLSFSFFTADYDARLMRGNAYFFRVHGDINHRIADFRDKPPNSRNVYILNPDDQPITRLGVFDTVNEQLVTKQQSMLIDSNPFVKVYRQLRNHLQRGFDD